jgi:hypothetical protein
VSHIVSLSFFPPTSSTFILKSTPDRKPRYQMYQKILKFAHRNNQRNMPNQNFSCKFKSQINNSWIIKEGFTWYNWNTFYSYTDKLFIDAVEVFKDSTRHLTNSNRSHNKQMLIWLITNYLDRSYNLTPIDIIKDTIICIRSN